jgi:thymidylate synthase ThyX
MKLINSSVEIIPQKPGLQGILENIELAARVCYKSESCIKYDEEGNSLTAKDFVDKIVNVYKHQSVAEHGTVYLKIPIKEYEKNYKNKYFPQK